MKNQTDTQIAPLDAPPCSASDWDQYGNPRNLEAASEDALLWLRKIAVEVHVKDCLKLQSAIRKLEVKLKLCDWRSASSPPAAAVSVLVTDGDRYAVAERLCEEWIDPNTERPLTCWTHDGETPWTPTHWKLLPSLPNVHVDASPPLTPQDDAQR